MLARTGGSRFAVVFIDCDVQGWAWSGAVALAWTHPKAMRIVERVRAATPGEITCTAGVACWDEHEATAELVERADDALRAARGRDPRRTVRASADREIEAALGQDGLRALPG